MIVSVIALCTLVSVITTVQSDPTQAATDRSPATTSGPNPSSTDNELRGVSALSATDVWAVGRYFDQRTRIYETLTVHWDGRRWSRVRSPSPSVTANALNGVSARTATDVWAVGNTQSRNLTFRWDGAAWETVHAPSYSWNDQALYAVSARSAGDAWAVGYEVSNDTGFDETLTLHWHGTIWNRVKSPNGDPFTNYLYGVSAYSADDAWAVGAVGVGSNQVRTLILHWDRTSWLPVHSPDPSSMDNRLAGVSAASTTDAWAVGSYRSDATHEYVPMTLHWDGTVWSRVNGPNDVSTDDYLSGVSALSATDAWAVGQSFDPLTGEYDTLILHWDGTSWSQVESPNPSSTLNELNGVSALSATDAWAVGRYLDDATGVYKTLMLHWDGTSWSQT
ncbi:MAG: hypothetical protein H0W27_06160 [Actinobacteria bacterium]|nr:hypothetical protein [Actinomycetota bacterium]